MSLPLVFFADGYAYRITDRSSTFTGPPPDHERVSAFEAHRVLEQQLRRDLWLARTLLRSRDCWNIPGDLPLSAFDEAFGSLACFRRKIVLPSPPPIEEVEVVEPALGEWIEVAFVDQDGQPIEVGVELELPSGRVMRGNTHTLHAIDRPGQARLRYFPNPGDSARQLHTLPGDHKVRQGQDMQSIAWAYGRADWQTIWDDATNDALREVCINPRTLLPGEIVHIPEPESEKETLAMSERHEFVVEVPRVHLRVQFLVDGQPRANEACTLEMDGEVADFTTDGDGVLDTPISWRTTRAVVRFAAPEEAADDGETLQEIFGDEFQFEEVERPHGQDVFLLRIGELDPPSTLSGARQRLNNLGFSIGERDDERTRQGMRLFQKHHGIEISNELDEKTWQKLIAENGDA